MPEDMIYPFALWAIMSWRDSVWEKWEKCTDMKDLVDLSKEEVPCIVWEGYNTIHNILLFVNIPRDSMITWNTLILAKFAEHVWLLCDADRPKQDRH